MLLVEDEVSIRRLVSAVLVRHGVAVEQAEDGVEAVRLLRDGGDRYDLVVLDVMMPRLDGIGVLRFMRDAGLEIPVIVISAAADVARHQLAPDLVKALVQKPFEIDDFVQSVLAFFPERDATLRNESDGGVASSTT